MADLSLLLEFYENMYKSRRFDERLWDAYTSGKPLGMTHLGIGEEACGTGSMRAFRPTDIVCPHHRSHAHQLMRGCDLKRLLSETLLKSTGMCQGKAGEAHFVDVSKNLYVLGGTLGPCYTVPVGFAYHLKHEGKGNIAVAYSGDGCTCEGPFYEAMNMAAAFKLPSTRIPPSRRCGSNATPSSCWQPSSRNSTRSRTSRLRRSRTGSSRSWTRPGPSPRWPPILCLRWQWITYMRAAEDGKECRAMETKTMTYMQALRLAMDEELARDDKVILLGQDVGILGGAYGVTGDLYHKYGPDRIIDSPLAENAIVGFGIGAAMMGWRPIMEIMKMDFSMVAVDPIVNHLAKYRFMSGGQIEKMPAVVRTAIGGGTRSGPHHSYSLHHIFAGFPGLKLVCASTPEDAKGLLKAAIRDDDPVFFCEETAAYRMKGEVPVDTDFIVPIGKSKVVCDGDAMTVVAFGTAALKSTKAAALLQEEGIYIDLIDLRSLRPLDLDPVIASVKRTGRLLVVDEFTEMYGISGEIAFQVSEKCFKDLKMPVQRYTLPDTIIPAGPVMEDWVMLSPAKIADRVKECIKA